MCQLCNESLLAASQAAATLARAAKDLYSINDHVNSKVLADAAADLFKPVKEAGAANDTPGPAPDKVEGVTLPRGFHIDDETGIVCLHGVALGRVVVLGKPTKH